MSDPARSRSDDGVGAGRPTEPTRRRTALVTGGTRGIGLGIARALARDGWDLALCGMRTESEAAPVLDELRRAGGIVHYWAADIARQDDRARLVAAVQERCGALHALVNNAGRAPRVRTDILEATEEGFEEVVRTNLQGPYFLTQAIAREQVDRRRADPAIAASII